LLPYRFGIKRLHAIAGSAGTGRMCGEKVKESYGEVSDRGEEGHVDTVNRRGLLLAFIPVVLSALIAGGLLYYLYVLKAPPPVVRIAADRTGSDIRELLEAVAKLAEARGDGLR